LPVELPAAASAILNGAGVSRLHLVVGLADNQVPLKMTEHLGYYQLEKRSKFQN